ncbi:L-2-amino-thiazoline-4-carboxylic acid hydrolase [Candidatus Bathyarchaeota archaeon]|nr:L-2-amino-thiazoline-4-carboxylic acid hydrolase [Candidatus Bathyarchaeota archaeon]
MGSKPLAWDEKHSLSWEEYFDTRFLEAIKLGKLLIKEIGEEKAYRMIAENAYKTETEFGRELRVDKILGSAEDLAEIFRELLDTPYFKKSCTVEVKDSIDGFSYDVTHCIWAHIFRKHDASELGYHMICHGDYGIANGLGEHVKLDRTKTLMLGEDCCDFRWVWHEP